MTSRRKQLAVSAVCAVLAVVSVFAYTATVSSEAQTKRQAAIDKYGGEQTQVVVATKAIGTGALLDDSNTKQVTWLTDLLPHSEVAVSGEQLKGLVAEVDIKEGEPILMDRVGDGNARISVPEGLEAVSIASDDVLAVGGSVQAGSFVDVYVETAKGKIALLGERVLVLETSAIVDKTSSKTITWVTLAVTPESVSDLISASTQGTIHLALPGNQSTEKE